MHAAAGEQAVGVNDTVDEVDDVNVYAGIAKMGGDGGNRCENNTRMQLVNWSRFKNVGPVVAVTSVFGPPR